MIGDSTQSLIHFGVEQAKLLHRMRLPFWYDITSNYLYRPYIDDSRYITSRLQGGFDGFFSLKSRLRAKLYKFYTRQFYPFGARSLLEVIAILFCGPFLIWYLIVQYRIVYYLFSLNSWELYVYLSYPR